MRKITIDSLSHNLALGQHDGASFGLPEGTTLKVGPKSVSISGIGDGSIKLLTAKYPKTQIGDMIVEMGEEVPEPKPGETCPDSNNPNPAKEAIMANPTEAPEANLNGKTLVPPEEEQAPGPDDLVDELDDIEALGNEEAEVVEVIPTPTPEPKPEPKPEAKPEPVKDEVIPTPTPVEPKEPTPPVPPVRTPAQPTTPVAAAAVVVVAPRGPAGPQDPQGPQGPAGKTPTPTPPAPKPVAPVATDDTPPPPPRRQSRKGCLWLLALLALLALLFALCAGMGGLGGIAYWFRPAPTPTPAPVVTNTIDGGVLNGAVMCQDGWNAGSVVNTGSLVHTTIPSGIDDVYYVVEIRGATQDATGRCMASGAIVKAGDVLAAVRKNPAGTDISMGGYTLVGFGTQRF